MDYFYVMRYYKFKYIDITVAILSMIKVIFHVQRLVSVGRECCSTLCAQVLQ